MLFMLSVTEKSCGSSHPRKHLDNDKLLAAYGAPHGNTDVTFCTHGSEMIHCGIIIDASIMLYCLNYFNDI